MPRIRLGKMSLGWAHTCSPRRAIQVEIGASIKEVPSQPWAQAVNLLVKLYAIKNSKTGTESIRGQRFGSNNSVEATKPSELKMVNNPTPATDSKPAGK